MASVIGLITLIGMVSVAAAIFDNVQDASHDIRTFSMSAMIGNLIAVSAALSAWSGVLWKKVKDEAKDPTTSLEWSALRAWIREQLSRRYARLEA
ncbi:hypothetical protein [Massilia rhizosphaerae]|uniref:hypothetical protein n=1 Tax=Massilia rhizosphaerae TaxID=2784389 RepID=UPI0018DB8251|nr:hypothetical protein [Massilia rhizosphaerae]